MLETIAWISLGVAFVCAAVIAVDERRCPQRMWIMNVVWPITALYFSVFALWAYYRVGRRMTKAAMASRDMAHHTHGAMQAYASPTIVQTAISATHCGAGCVLGDLIAEFGLFALGWTLLGTSLYAEYAGDLIFAWLLGIAFQYFAIQPMGGLSNSQALIAAIKSDTLSILTFEIGLFAWMAFTFFVLFPDPHLNPTQPQYWLMMQIGMVLGFLTSYPMNKWLIENGWKEAM